MGKLYKNDIAGLGVSTWEFEYHNPYADFPTDNYAMSYYVTVTDLKGNTWDHKFNLTTREMHYSDCQSRMDRFLDRIKEALKGGGCIDLEHWLEGQPAYGSEAWQEFEHEEIAPYADALHRGSIHVEDLPDSVRGYF